VTQHTAVSDPAQEMVGVLASVESHLTEAAGLADRLTASMRRRQAELVEIGVRARKGVHTGKRSPHLHTTFELAALTRSGLQHGGDIGDELIAFLDLTRTSLHLAHESISRSASLVPSVGGGEPDLEVLPHWVGHLDRIIQSACVGTKRAITHLHSAERSLDQLEVKPGAAADEVRQDARQVQAVVTGCESHITRAKSTLGLARAFLEDGRLAARQGTEAARRLSVEDVLPSGTGQVRPHPTSVHGAAPARTSRTRAPVTCSPANCGIPR
jgi:hypothetical protein